MTHRAFNDALSHAHAEHDRGIRLLELGFPGRPALAHALASARRAEGIVDTSDSLSKDYRPEAESLHRDILRTMRQAERVADAR